MKLKDVLELTLTDSLDLIAKNHLEIGKNAARDALKKAGCYAKNGRRGWFYEGDPAVLEKSIYDFIEKKNTQTSVKPENKQTELKVEKQERKITGKEKNLKKATYEVEEWVHDELKIQAIRQKQTISEIVNEILKKTVEEKGADHG
ncbi:hypothetical protein [Domibacillus enclensis]|uniref:Uncharacterized protein n=1 Tax=Domibacillus enclensis TaxID=1017273 RepID=A0A1N7D0S3_9BACI|nr:hypothetical protein [Domibacillus enclensis]OXS72952.1 hypothetical protein B1B05_18925 [Domibacillus enclensis]SIR69377.1 hypothetical protein SAMN05443094_1192 [Domibacillus enclensis]